MIGAIFVAASLVQAAPMSQPGFDLDACLGHAITPAAVIECQAKSGGGGSDGGPVPVGDSAGKSTLARSEYIWLPACPNALPDTPDVYSISCAASESCDAAGEVRQTLWARRVMDARGRAVDEPWAVTFTQCRSAAGLGPVPEQRTLTTGLILQAIRRLGVPASKVEGPAYTLVNLETTFYTRPQPVERSLTIIGYGVDVEITPTSYRWEWGDGSSETSATPGRPYPSTDITHIYLHDTPRGSTAVSVDVTYSARFRVDGGSWQTIPDALTIPGAPSDVPVKQATGVLVAGD